MISTDYSYAPPVRLVQPPFLPMSRREMDVLGWDCLDILLLSGDAYIDHPSFAVALLGRWLVHHGYRVGIVTQPNWKNRQEALGLLRKMGRPRLFAGASAGAVDSMVAHYTAFRKKRHNDAYTPGGSAGARPNRACIVYTGLLREAFPYIPVVLGGIEASLRRAAHYDFWSDTLRRPLLFDSKADLLVYGMGEKTLLKLAQRADAALHVSSDPKEKTAIFAASCHDIPGLAYVSPASALPRTLCETTELMQNVYGTSSADAWPYQYLPGYESILETRSALLEAALALEKQVHHNDHALLQQVQNKVLVINPPGLALNQEELDELYALPFSRLSHPLYREPIPAWEMIRSSITSHRGCGGGCSFCSLALHQGRRITSRSTASILKEAQSIAALKKNKSSGGKWASSISDLGGPSANMWQAECTLSKGKCLRTSCLVPEICRHFSVDQSLGIRLLRTVKDLPGIRHVRVASGLRFDLALQDAEALAAYAAEFAGGQLKAAPEHCSAHVLKAMRKPAVELFEHFLNIFQRSCEQAGQSYYVIPYLMSAFPGCTMDDMRVLAAWLKRRHWKPQQVQCFIPTPGTVASAMYFAGVDAEQKPIYVARSDKERLEQHRLLAPSLGQRPGKNQKSQKVGDI